MSELGFHWPSLIVYLVNFTILLAILYMVGYKPIMRILDQRSERIRGSLDEAERTRKESEERQAEMQKELAQAGWRGRPLSSRPESCRPVPRRGAATGTGGGGNLSCQGSG